MNIELEKEISKNYTLTMDKTNKKLVELTLDNVARILILIMRYLNHLMSF